MSKINLFVILVCILFGDSLTQFCESNITNLYYETAFVLGHNIYFGYGNKLWKYNTKQNKVADKQIELNDLFPESILSFLNKNKF